MTSRAWIVSAGLALCTIAAPAFAACSVQKIVDMPVTMRGLKPLTQVTINGTPQTLAINSGAGVSLLTFKAAQALKLPQLHDRRLIGVGGLTSNTYVTTVDTLLLQDQVLHDIPFTVTSGVAASGAIGENLLGRADTEYDFAHGAVRLFQSKDCSATDSMAYWVKGEDLQVIGINWQDPEGRNPHTRADAAVNGAPVSVVLSSGSPMSFLSLTAARRVGVKVDGPGARYIGLVGGVGPDKVKAWVVPVASFKIGDEEIRNTQLRVLDESGSYPRLSNDMVLGADFFLAHRIYVANSQHKLYFTYNGGRVFALDEPEGQAR